MLSKLIAVLILIESGGNDRAIGDRGQAIGCLQIHPSFVVEVNRIAGASFTLQDRWDRQRSIAMVSLMMRHQMKLYKARTGHPITIEILTRMHNGGYAGYWLNPQAKTDRYWSKVSKHLNNDRRNISP